MGENPYTVKVKKGAKKRKSFEIKNEALVLGSSEEADIVLEGPGVEPRHAQIVFQGGRVILEDLGTQSGTFRNGQRLLGPLQVFPGDRIGLGPEVELILEGDDPSQGAPANAQDVLEEADDDLAGDVGLTSESSGEG